MKISTVITDKLTVDYFSFGKGKKNAVIIPGMSIKSVMLSAPIIEKDYGIFYDSYSVYVFDRKREFSESYSIEEAADDLFEALKALQIGNIYLFGVSQGGMIAQVIAGRHPEYVKKLFLASTVAEIDENAFRVFDNWERLANEKNGRALGEDFARKVYSGEFCEKNKEAFACICAGATDEEFGKFAVSARACIDFDNIGNLKNIKCPVKMAAGELDCIFSPGLVRKTAEKLKCRLEIKKGYAHALYDEDPDFKKEVFEFFEE